MRTVIEEIKTECTQQTDKANYPAGISAPQARMVITKPLPLKISQGRDLLLESSRNFPCPSDTKSDHKTCRCQTMNTTFSPAWPSPVLKEVGNMTHGCTYIHRHKACVHIYWHTEQANHKAAVIGGCETRSDCADSSHFWLRALGPAAGSQGEGGGGMSARGRGSGC